MNTFWMTFLCLLIGGMMGYEIGKATEARRMRMFLDKLGNSVKDAMEKQQVEEAKRRDNIAECLGLLEKSQKTLEQLKEKRNAMQQENTEKQKEQTKE